MEKLRGRSLAFAEAREKLARKKKWTALDWSKCNEADTSRVGERPVLKGMDLPVEDILTKYEEGISIPEICKNFAVSAAKIQNLLRYAQQHDALARPLS